MEPAIDPIPLGPFDLHRRLGEGGMGEVWWGVHVAQQVPVAVKVITRDLARQQEYLDAFRREVQATARLDHPHIVMVFDHGRISADTERCSHGRLVAGSPYLVMEYAGSGSLATIALPLTWHPLKTVLVTILQALACSHARGLLHRDLKPANILVAGDQDVRPGLKLTDFGIACALETQDPQGSVEVPVGTPSYMSPEQFAGRIRDYGPWTDLYSLGCVAYQLATGRLPFKGANLLQLIKAHLEDPVPRFGRTHPLAAGFESWVLRLLQKDPADRFQRAADALRALLELKDEEAAGPDHLDLDSGEPEEPPTLLLDTGLTRPMALEAEAPPTEVMGPQDYSGSIGMADVTPDGTQEVRPGAQLAGEEELPPAPCPVPPVWIPHSWRSLVSAPPPMRLVGAGLGLFGLRQIALVNRDGERDTIWHALKEVHQTGLARFVLLSGPAGSGKSRLVEWVSERAEEIGAATILRAVHGPTPGHRDGVGAMIARHLRCVGLGQPHLVTRVEKVLRRLGVVDDYEWRALAEIIHPTAEEQTKERGAIQFGGREERFAVFHRFLTLSSRDRPVIVCLDDVQWGQDTLGYIEQVMRLREHLPARVLFLATARSETLAERPAEAAQVETILALPGSTRCSVPPLEEQDQAFLVGQLLYLGDDLVRQVVERTGGNPLFAVHLVGDWVRRGVLEVTTQGFVLKAGERAVLPEDLHEVWSARIDRLIEEIAAATGSRRQRRDRTAGAIEALELAAVLGQSVDEREWEQACILSGAGSTGGLVALLVSSRLAIPNDTGWSFVHAMLRESLLRRAEADGRLQQHHRTCASALERCHGQAIDLVAERIGHHRLQAGDLAGALDPLLRGAKWRMDRSEYPAAMALLVQREEAVEALRRSGRGDLHRTAQGWVVRARLLHLQFLLEDAVQWARSAADIARSQGYTDVLIGALRLVFHYLREKATFAQALQVSDEALALASSAGDRHSLALCRFDRLDLLLSTGRIDDAWAIASELQKEMEELDDPILQGRITSTTARILMSLEDNRSARVLFERALAFFQERGYRRLAANCLNNLGELSRLARDFEQAEREYRQAIQIYHSLGVTQYLIPVFNLQLIHLEMGRYEEARQGLEQIVDIARKEGFLLDLTYAQTAMLVCIAGLGLWIRWSRQWDEVQQLLEQTDECEPDIPWLFALAGKLAADAGARGCAIQALEKAVHFWNRLGAKTEADATQAALDSL